MSQIKTSSHAPPTLDQAAFEFAFEQNFAGDWEIFLATATAFLESTDDNLNELLTAFAAADVDRTMKAAHRLKGETSLFHIAEIPAEFKTIEAEARDGRLPSAATVAGCRVQLARLVGEIRALMVSRAA